jgi:hypothetical protein
MGVPVRRFGPILSGPIPVDSSLDDQLRTAASRLFEIDEVALDILAVIAEKGPQLVYGLAKGKKLSKATIYRRLQGNVAQPSLIKEKYLRLEGVAPFGRIQDREKKYYGLGLKGFLASLSKVQCEHNYMFKIFLEMYRNHPIFEEVQAERLADHQDRELWENVVQLIKVDLLLFFRYHLDQGLRLTYIKNPTVYFWIMPEHLMPTYYGHDSNISPDLKALLTRRDELESAIVIPTKRDKIPLPGVVGRLLVDGPLFLVRYFPWQPIFSACCATEAEFTHLLPEIYELDSSYPTFRSTFPDRYNCVIKALQGREPEWHIDELVAGTHNEEGSTLQRRARIGVTITRSTIRVA